MEIDSDMVFEIVQSTLGAAFVLVVLLMLYKTRSRFNRIVHRVAPKSKYPDPKHPYPPENNRGAPDFRNTCPPPQHFQRTSPSGIDMLALTNVPQQHTQYSVAGYNRNEFNNLHNSMKGIFKPNENASCSSSTLTPFQTAGKPQEQPQPQLQQQ